MQKNLIAGPAKFDRPAKVGEVDELHSACAVRERDIV
jgi:hypothetical protein